MLLGYMQLAGVGLLLVLLLLAVQQRLGVL